MADIDLLIQQMRAYDADNSVFDEAFDLNDDGSNDRDDLEVMVLAFLVSEIGDSNFDGEFTTTDFVTVFGFAKYETGIEASWEEGDWNGDGYFNTADFVFAFEFGDYENND